MPTVSTHSRVGLLLREWRSARRLSQLTLALDADLSARHLSYIETGKANPSREMIERLASVLGLSLRERNALLMAGGFAPRHPETALARPELALMRRAIELMLAQQEPYPAFLLNHHWDIVEANAAAQRVNSFVLEGRAPRHRNMLLQFFDPSDLRSAIVNWDEVARALLRHLHLVVSATPTDARARALLAQVLAFPDVPDTWQDPLLRESPSPLLHTVLQRGDQVLRFFSTITTFGTPRDITLEELHIESCFPADEATAALCRELAGGNR
jgi:transcriptional regulator with XRE-family HTH domain